jgi:hypothetical protein
MMSSHTTGIWKLSYTHETMKWKRQTRCQCCEMFLAGSLPGSWRTQTTVGCLLCPTAAHPTIPFVSLRSQMSPPQIAFCLPLFPSSHSIHYFHVFVFFVALGYWTQGPMLARAIIPPLEPCHQPFLLLVIFEKGSHSMPRLARTAIFL